MAIGLGTEPLARQAKVQPKHAICVLFGYGEFTEGFDTRDLKEAQALLEGLAP